MPRFRPVALGAVLAVALLLPAAASARVAVVASGTTKAVLVDTGSNAVAGALALPGRTRAVAAAPDGTRAFVAAGNQVVAIDLAARARSGAIGLPSRPVALAVSSDGARILALRGRALELLDAATLARLGAINLKARGVAVAIAPSGTRAVVALERGAVAVVDLTARRVARRVKVADPTGVAMDAVGRAWVSSTVTPKRRKGSRRRPAAPSGALVGVSPTGGAV